MKGPWRTQPCRSYYLLALLRHRMHLQQITPWLSFPDASEVTTCMEEWKPPEAGSRREANFTDHNQLIPPRGSLVTQSARGVQ
jgi:hypothetical protein